MRPRRGPWGYSPPPLPRNSVLAQKGNLDFRLQLLFIFEILLQSELALDCQVAFESHMVRSLDAERVARHSSF